MSCPCLIHVLFLPHSCLILVTAQNICLNTWYFRPISTSTIKFIKPANLGWDTSPCFPGTRQLDYGIREKKFMNQIDALAARGVRGSSLSLIEALYETDGDVDRSSRLLALWMFCLIRYRRPRLIASPCFSARFCVPRLLRPVSRVCLSPLAVFQRGFANVSYTLVHSSQPYPSKCSSSSVWKNIYEK